jgi:hypothetical protein
LTVPEMEAKSMARNSRRFWVSERLSQDAISKRGDRASSDFSVQAESK